MKAMSPEATELVNAGRQAFRPTEADRARLMVALAGTATLSVGAVAARAAERSLSSIFNALPARVLALAFPLAAAGAYGWHVAAQSPATVQTARSLGPAPVIVVPTVTAQPVPAAEVPAAEPPSEPSEPSVSVAAERSPSSGDSSKPGVEIRQEVALLSKAQAALSRGRPQEALEALAEHAQRFPRGALTEERAATRARTLCALGRRQEAETELKRVEKLNPTSAYLARAREACLSR
jgi:tetratricopeptide (TPR) repeat protein